MLRCKIPLIPLFGRVELPIRAFQYWIFSKISKIFSARVRRIVPRITERDIFFHSIKTLQRILGTKDYIFRENELHVVGRH
jgi:hypothetical protein